MRKVITIKLDTHRIETYSINDNEKIIVEKDDLVFESPILAGYGIIGINRLDIYSKSSNSKVGGHFAHYMKCSGYDYLIFKGISKYPIYIYINKEAICIKDARNIYCENFNTSKSMIEKALKTDNLEMAQIGVAAVNEVEFSKIIFESNKSCGGNGLGRLMGLKKIKAIALEKHNKLNCKDEKTLIELNNLMINRLGDTNLNTYYDENNKCYGCIMNCKNTLINKIMKQGFTLEEAKSIENICNEYGMDCISYSKILIRYDDLADLTKKVVFENEGNKTNIKNKEIKIHNYRDKFEELGFCRILIERKMINDNELDTLKDCILG